MGGAWKLVGGKYHPFSQEKGKNKETNQQSARQSRKDENIENKADKESQNLDSPLKGNSFEVLHNILEEEGIIPFQVEETQIQNPITKE